VRVSARGQGVVTFGYDDFPVAPVEADLRGDNSTPLAAVSAAIDLMPLTATDIAGYGPVAGVHELRASIGDIFHVPAAQVVITAGASEALNLALTCTADVGQTVSLPRPAFPGFEQIAGLAGLRVRHYSVPSDDEPPLVAADSAAVVICTPHNPTGRLTPHSEPPDGNAYWRIWDISHTSLFGPDADGFRGCLAASDILICSLSKLLRLPGARLGCMIVPAPELRDAVIAAKTHLSMSASRLSQVLALTVLQAPATPLELKERQERLTELREHLQSAVQASTRMTVVPAAGGTHLLVHTRTNQDPWQLLKDAGVVGLPGKLFNAQAPSVRLCAAQPTAVIDIAAARIRML
jgi:aspartate/methionine/tyrosine aminotransferase